MSLLAFLVSLTLALQVGRQFIQRRKPHQLLWSIALTLFSIGTACQLLGETVGWSVVIYRIWYLTGVVLTAAYLGQGTLYLQVKRSKANAVMAVLFLSTAIALVLVSTAQVKLDQALQGDLVTGGGMPSSVRILTPFFNIFGTIVLVGGALQSAGYFLWNGRGDWRALGTALIAVGTIILAIGGTLTRLGFAEVLYVSEVMGVCIIFAGFHFSNRAADHVVASVADLRRRRQRIAKWGVSTGVVSLLGLVVMLPALPWAMDIVRDAQHVYTERVPEENRGAYLLTNDGVMQLYTWKVDPPNFPSDAPTLTSGDLLSIMIVQKQFEEPPNYKLYNIGTREPLNWAWTQQEDSMHLRLVPPKDIEPGEYMLVVPTDSMFGGYNTHYFRLQ